VNSFKPQQSNYQSVRSRKFGISLLCEFLGTMLFSFIGSTVASPILGPFVNGFALATAIYTAANISGGHLNPAVTISALLCGFYPLFHSILYIIL
jgi:aquaporin TIP